ncbi:MAG: hypothetical protein V4636_20105 [Pseudomonadota bacterium]
MSLIILTVPPNRLPPRAEARSLGEETTYDLARRLIDDAEEDNFPLAITNPAEDPQDEPES